MKFVLTSSAAAIIIGVLAMACTSPATGESSAQKTETISVSVAPDAETIVRHPTELVELFTSQGCSSCPPADKFVASLADDPSVLALSFNVTYWDYLGWKDRFGKREFTNRQKAYARALDIGNVYTPQIVLNGTEHSNRYTRKQIKAATLSKNRPLFDLAASGSTLSVKMKDGYDMSSSDLTLIAYKPGLQATPIERGENRRRTLENYNVVQGVYPLGADTRYSLDISDHDTGLAYALLASDPKTAEVVSMTQFIPE